MCPGLYQHVGFVSPVKVVYGSISIIDRGAHDRAVFTPVTADTLCV